jgi:hypothetical protein
MSGRLVERPSMDAAAAALQQLRKSVNDQAWPQQILSSGGFLPGLLESCKSCNSAGMAIAVDPRSVTSHDEPC